MSRTIRFWMKDRKRYKAKFWTNWWDNRSNPYYFKREKKPFRREWWKRYRKYNKAQVKKIVKDKDNIPESEVEIPTRTSGWLTH